MIVYRLFTAGEYDKREKWVNQMCKKGYALKNFGLFKYEFEKCNPGEYYYCIELLENLSSNPEDQDYINFLRDEWKIEYIGCNYNWAFFRRKSMGGKFSLFSSKEAKLSYFKRILTFRIFVVFALIFFTFSNLILSTPNLSDKIFSVLGIFLALLISLGNIPNFKKYFKLKKAIHY